MKRLFIIATWIAALALPAVAASACIVNCCALRAAMPQCSGMAQVLAAKPLQNASTTEQKSAPSMKPLLVTVAPAAVAVPARIVTTALNDRDIGLHLLLATLLI